MGRVTLNVLLSFAQFEREIISERTRDKQSAARRKGKWVSGYPVVGYDADPNTCRLVVNEAEAQQVRQIFDIFLRRGSLAATLEEVQRRGWRMKTWTTRKGKQHIGRLWDRPALMRLITNLLYIGEVSHQGKTYPGEHEAIVRRTIWMKASALLKVRSRGTEVRPRNRNGALLKDLVECAVCGGRMVNSYTTRRGRQYRYYVCSQVQKWGANACPGQRVAAARIEQAVMEKLYELAGNPEWQNRSGALPVSPADWERLRGSQPHSILGNLVERIGYDHRQDQARLRLRYPEAGGVDGQEILIRIRKKAWETVPLPLARVKP